MGRVLVLGASGLVGRAVLQELGADGVAAPSDLRVSHGTVDRVRKLVAQVQPVAVVNAVGRTEGAAEELRAANVEPAEVLLEAVAGARLVHIGSAAEYGGDGDTDRRAEDAPLRGDTPYARSKIEASRLVEAAGDAVVARVFNPIGAGMPPTSLPGLALQLLREAVASGAQRVELGSLDAVRDYVDLRDVGRAIRLLALRSELEHRVYNVGSGRPTIVRDLVELIARRVGYGGEIAETAVGSSRSLGVRHQVADIGRMEALGWGPTTSLRESVDALVVG